MRRSAARRSVWVFGGLCLGALAAARGVRAQAPTTPPPSPDPNAQVAAPAVVPAGLGDLVGRMAEQTRRLGAVVSAEVGGSDRGRRLQQETVELAQAVGEFRQSVRDQADRFQVRRAFAGVEANWNVLVAELGRQGTSTPALDRATGEVAQTVAQIRQALGMNTPPAGYYGAQAPTGLAEVQRLAHSLVDRAEALAAAVRTEMPGAVRAVQDAVNLATLADTFHDGLRLEGAVDRTIANGYTGVAAQADRLGQQFAQTPATPGVAAAWQTFRSVDVLLRRELGIHTEPAILTGTVLAPGAASPVVGLADQLVQQVSDFVQVFGPTAGAVPEGGLFLADAQTLLSYATAFQRSAAAGTSPGQLAFEFRGVDAVWQRLARRTNRIARGRTGPNIQQVGRMGQTVAEIHRLLGIPGYPPVIVTVP